MKVVERIFEHRIRQQIKIDDMQFGFMKGKGTTDAIFMARQVQENFRVKGKKLYFDMVDLEKAFDRVPREVISLAMRKLGVEVGECFFWYWPTRVVSDKRPLNVCVCLCVRNC